MLFITLALLAVLAVMRIVQLGGFRARLARILSIPELGALTLAEANLSTNNPIVPGIVETFVKESPVIDRIQFKDIQGNAYKYNEELTLPGVEFRAVNAAYSESTGTINPKTESIVILGGDADVDTFLVKTGGNLADLRATQDKMKAKIASSARRLTIYDQTVDSFGRHIQTYNGIPLLDIGNKADGTLVIPQTLSLIHI